MASLELAFSADPILSATTFRRIVENDEPHSVLRACFERWEKQPSISEQFRDYLTGRWRLWIYPVRRELRAVAKVALIDDGLPKIAKWMSLERPESWYFGRKVCEVIFIPREGSVKAEEKVEKS